MQKKTKIWSAIVVAVAAARVKSFETVLESIQ